MSEMRGKIVRITFSVEYPDGSTKESSFTPIERLNAVLLSEDYMNAEMKQMFTKSRSDWKLNPAMIIVDGSTLKPNCDYPDCIPA